MMSESIFISREKYGEMRKNLPPSISEKDLLKRLTSPGSGYYVEGLNDHLMPHKNRGNLFTDIMDSLDKRAGKAVEYLHTPDQSFPEGLYQTGGQFAGFLSDTLGSIFKRGAQVVGSTVGEPTKSVLRGIGKLASFTVSGNANFAESEMGKLGLETLSEGMEKYQDFKNRHPRAARNIEATVNMAQFVPFTPLGIKTVKTGVKAIEPLITKGEKILEKTISPVVQTAKRTGMTFEESAERSIQRALGATTQTMKLKSERAAKGILERPFGETFAFTRKGLERKAGEAREIAGEAIDEAGTLIGKTPARAVIDALESEKEEFIKGGIVIDAPAVENIEHVQDIFRQYGDYIDDDILREIRRSWDKRIALRKKGIFTLTPGEADELSFKKLATNRIRSILAAKHPNVSRLNKEFNFWSDFNEVIEATNKRMVGQQGALEQVATIGGGISGAAGGPASMIVRALSFRMLMQAFRSPGWRFASARMKNTLAKLLGAGNTRSALEFMYNSKVLRELADAEVLTSVKIFREQGEDALVNGTKNQIQSQIDDLTDYAAKIREEITIRQEFIGSQPDMRRLMKRATEELPEVSGSGKGRSTFARTGDEIAENLGFEDSEALREMHGTVMRERSEVNSLKKTLYMAENELQNMQRRLSDLGGNIGEPRLPQFREKSAPLFSEKRLAGLKTIGDVDFPSFEGFPDLSTSIVESLQGRTRVSKQFIEDLTNQGSVRQFERDMIRSTLKEFGDEVPVKDFAVSVRQQLLPLELRQSSSLPIAKERSGFYPEESLIERDFLPLYEHTALPDELRGKVHNYTENIYQSPIGTSAGDIHFSSVENPNYFAHTRIEDMADGKTRRVIEVQSDLFQKGRMENSVIESTMGTNPENRIATLKKELENGTSANPEAAKAFIEQYEPQFNAKKPEIAKLEPYRNTWHERILREEIKQAAIDGKTKLRIPTGKTAMKIEGLGETKLWKLSGGKRLIESDLKVGASVNRFGSGEEWIITDVIGDGEFKAVPKSSIKEIIKGDYGSIAEGFTKHIEGTNLRYKPDSYETFDISGKVDTSNPIYRFYEKTIQRYLKNSRPDMKRIKDKQEVEWFEIPIKPEDADLPVLAMNMKQAIA